MRKFLPGLAVLSAVTTGLVFAAPSVFGPDVGPKADVAAVRTAEHQLAPKMITGAVHVVGDYALLQWEVVNEADGQDVFKRISDERWKRIGHGGGAIGLSGLVQAGVPTSVARQLCSGWPKGYSPC